MRNTSTAREKSAYYWFMEHFIDCVAGKIQCRKSKYLATVSNSIITISDEACALVLFEIMRQSGMPSISTVSTNAN